MNGIIIPFDGWGMALIAIAYLICGEPFARKSEYTKFYLFFLSFYFLIFTLIGPHIWNMQSDLEIENLRFFFFLFFAPSLLLANLIYPFKEVKRSKQITVFTAFVSLFLWGIWSVGWLFATLFM